MNSLVIHLQIMLKEIQTKIVSLQKSLSKQENADKVKDDKIKTLQEEIKQLKAQLKGKPKPKPEEPKTPDTPTTPQEPNEPEKPDPDTPTTEEPPVTDPDVDQPDIVIPPPEVVNPNEPTPEIPQTPGGFVIPEKRVGLRAEHSFTKASLPSGFRQQTANPLGLQYVTEAGQQWARFVLSAADNSKKIIRSEILLDPASVVGRYGYTMRFPTDNWPSHTTEDIITQWHNHEDKNKGEKALVPPIALFVENDWLHLMVCWDSKQVTTNTNREGKQNYKLIPLPKDQDVVFNWFIRHSYKTFKEDDPRYKTESGLIILSINGVQVLKRYGPNAYNDAEFPGYFKIGIYSRHVKYKRVILMKDIYVGTEKSGFLDVMPKLNKIGI